MSCSQEQQDSSVSLLKKIDFKARLCLRNYYTRAQQLAKYISSLERRYILLKSLNMKKGLNPMERFKKEVLGSQCFDRVKKKIPNFDDYINTHVRPVSGDLVY
jgi:hypothetical protein